MNFRDLTDQKFGRLKVVKFAYFKSGSAHWHCLCVCKTKKIVRSSSLVTGNTKSCGCLQKDNGRKQGLDSRKHGEGSHQRGRTRTYGVWQGMLRRCLLPSSTSYSRYGGAGITICAEWLSYPKFKADMGAAPLGLSLDRIDNSLGYFKENCRWATREQQNRNQKSNINLTFMGKTQTLAEWARDVGLPKGTLWGRIKRSGWSVERALTTPSGPSGIRYT